MGTSALWVLLLPIGPLYPLLSAIILTWFEIAQMFSGLRAAGILMVADMPVCCGIGQPASEMW